MYLFSDRYIDTNKYIFRIVAGRRPSDAHYWRANCSLVRFKALLHQVVLFLELGTQIWKCRNDNSVSKGGLLAQYVTQTSACPHDYPIRTSNNRFLYKCRKGRFKNSSIPNTISMANTKLSHYASFF